MFQGKFSRWEWMSNTKQKCGGKKEKTRQRIHFKWNEKKDKNYDISDVFSGFVVVLCHVFLGSLHFIRMRQQYNNNMTVFPPSYFVYKWNKWKRNVQANKRKGITHLSDKLKSNEDDVQSAYHEELVTLSHMLFVLTRIAAWPNYYGYDVFSWQLNLVLQSAAAAVVK